MGSTARARVSLIAADGTVLGDSEVPSGELGRLENHRGRPEVLGALARGEGSSARESVTLGRRMMYVAVAFPEGSASPAGVVRLAVALTAVGGETLGASGIRTDSAGASANATSSVWPPTLTRALPPSRLRISTRKGSPSISISPVADLLCSTLKTRSPTAN